mgnify:CR=1 FL=1
MTEFIEKTEKMPFMAHPRNFAINQRALGIGALGWHAYLQRKNVPWESSMAVGMNKNIFKTVREKLDVANKELGAERGEAPDAQSKILFEDDAGNSVEFNSSDTVTVFILSY